MDAMRWMTGLTLGGVALLGGCLQAKANDCGGGIFCPADLECAPAPLHCATRDEIAACAGVADEVECSTVLTPKGLCASGACSPCSPEDVRCRYDAWTPMTTPVGDYDLQAIWAGGPADIYAVGSEGTVLHFDGVAWTREDAGFGTTPSALGIWGSTPSDFYVALNDSRLFHHAGSWTTVAESISPSIYMQGIWGSAATNVVVVGVSGQVRHLDGTGWSSKMSGTTQPLNAIWGRTQTEVYAVGNRGTVIQYDGASWMPVTAGLSALVDLTAVWGTSAGDLFAVGEDGAAGVSARFIAARRGGTWTTQTDPPPMTGGDQLSGVWGTSATNVFVVGTGGTILHYDGTRWESMPTPSASILFAITGTSSGDAYAVGENGLIWRYSFSP
jgi:hypothetical protein